MPASMDTAREIPGFPATMRNCVKRNCSMRNGMNGRYPCP